MNKFKLENYLSKYEFKAPYLLCCSDPESMSMGELLSMASDFELEQWKNLRLGYTEVKGAPLLRKSIAKMLYHTLDENNISCFSGAEEGIFCALNVLAKKEDHVIVLTPAYQSFFEIPIAQGVSVTKIALREDNDWKIDIDEIKNAINKNTKLLIINFPHNPTGQIIDKNELEELIKLCKKNDLWLFSDEVYHLLGNDECNFSWPVADLYEKGFSLGVTSKAFGLAGLRIGWIASSDQKMLKKMEGIRHYTSISSGAPSEILAQIAINNKNNIIKRNNNIINTNLLYLDKFLEKNKELFSWVKPKGGCTGFIKYYGPRGMDDFCYDLVKKTGVLLLPGSIYEMREKYFRIGFGRKNFKECLLRLEDYINENI